MRILIRSLETENSGVLLTQDRVLETDTLTLGRATDQNVHINDPRVGLQHARLVRVGGELRLSCAAPAQVEVNGRLQRDAVLRVGDEISLGPLLIRVIEPAAEFDVALTLERDAREGAVGEEAPLPKFSLSLAEIGWRKRPWAWAGGALTLVFGLILPLLLVNRSEASREWVRQSVLPSDLQWSSGALHSGHASLEVECESCHVQPFQRVRNAECVDCHAPMLHQHLPEGHPATQALEQARCTSCHVEHDEPSNLTSRDSRLCTACHAAPEDHGALPGALVVTDFAAEHPEFRVSLLKAPDWKVDRRRLGTPGVIEQSNLEFTHQAHLVAEGIKAPQGKVVMQCADCHRPDADNEGFLPITMEQHCSSCHTLGFDPAEPARTLPHAEPSLVLQTLIDHYSRRYLDGYADRYAASGATAPPGAMLSSGERARVMGGAKERALQVAADVFERRICADCHTVERKGTATDPRWHVAPVKLTDTFMPKARFDHGAHATSDFSCQDCHAAKESKRATDVLMPQIAQCRDCHGGATGVQGNQARVPSPCASCHRYDGSGR